MCQPCLEKEQIFNERKKKCPAKKSWLHTDQGPRLLIAIILKLHMKFKIVSKISKFLEKFNDISQWNKLLFITSLDTYSCLFNKTAFLISKSY